MTKSFVSLALALGFMIFAQTCFFDAEGFSENNYDYFDDYEDDDEDEKNPATICTLFGKHACHIECSLEAHLFGYTAYGECADDICKCYTYRDVSLHQEWKKVFDAEYVYRKINENQLAINQVQNIFLDPFRTAHEFKNLIESILTSYQFSQLRIRDDNVTNKFTTADGALDEEALRKLVSEKIKTVLKTQKAKALLNVNYKDRFRRALEKSNGSKATLYNCTSRVKRLKNQSLQNILDEYLKKHKIQKPEINVVQKPCVLSIIDNVVINEIIKRIDETSAASAPKKKVAAKAKPAPKKA